MSLFLTIREAIAAARREANEQGKLRLTTLSLLLAALQNEAIALHAKEQGLSDEQVIAVVRREVKRRKDAAQVYRDHGEEARALIEEAENKILAVYLPAAPSDEMIRMTIFEITKGLPEHERNVGRVMKEAMARLKGADGSVVRAMVQQILTPPPPP
ncbi:MAG: GatB/YqeY domain-containing protein [Patescibacteria group bacterium]